MVFAPRRRMWMDKSFYFLYIIVLLTCLETDVLALGKYPNNNLNLGRTGNSTVTEQYQNTSIPGFVLGLANYGGHRIKQNILDENGKLEPAFICNSIDENSCFVLDIFQDRSLFYFEFEALYNYYPRTPKVESQTISVRLQESLTLEAHDPLDSFRRGAFSVFYDCPLKAIGPTTHMVKINLPLGQPGINISFSYLKRCGYGTHPYASLVLENEEGDEMTKDTIVLDPVTSIFQLSLLVNNAEAVQTFGAPKTIYDHHSYSLRISGQGADRGGTVLGGEKITWILQDECIGNLNGIPRQANICVPIPPFEPLSIQFSKDCGGGRPRGLHIGFTPGFFDVMEDGVLLKSPIKVLNETDKMLELYLTLQGQSVPRSLLVGPPILDILDPFTVSVRLTSNTRIHNSIGFQAVLLKEGDRKLFTFSFVCKRTGQTTVNIEFPVRSREKVVLRLVKRCKAPSTFRNSTFLTADFALIILTLFAFVFGFCAVRKLQPLK